MIESVITCCLYAALGAFALFIAFPVCINLYVTQATRAYYDAMFEAGLRHRRQLLQECPETKTQENPSDGY